MRNSRQLVFVAIVCMSPTVGLAAELTYEADVRPILKTHCFHCHGEEGTTEGGLDLRLRRLVAKGGESGPAIVAGDASKSLLVRRVTSGAMPPDEDKRLSKAEVELLRKWVDAGAPTARDEPESLDADVYFTEEERNWWSFRPVVRPPVPSLSDEAATPIDAFLLAALKKRGEEQGAAGAAFRFSARAERQTLIRRVYLDMLGVPPSPEDVREFLADTSPAAWLRLVDRVLASPHYGERWGRHWLDAAGYADSEGYTDEDRVREHAWRYRDYVIRAYNDDKPYTDFLVEQLAGDELVGWPNATLEPKVIEALAATGYLRMAPDGTASGGIDRDLARNQVVADTLQIVGTSLLGITLHCAQCHDHRYDPIPTRDYYQLRAILEPAFDWKSWVTPPNRLVSLYTDEDKRRRTEIEGKAKKVDDQRQERIDFYIGKTLEHELLMVANEIQEPLRTAFRTASGERTAEQKKLLEGHVNIANITAGSLYLYDRRREARAKDLEQRRTEKETAYLVSVKQQALQSIDAGLRDEVSAAFAAEAEQRTERQQQLVDEHPAVGATADTLATFNAEASEELQRYTTAAAEIREYRIANELKELQAQASSIRETIPKEHFLRVLAEKPGHTPETFVFYRGDHQQPKEAVEPQGLSVLGAASLAGADALRTSGRRLQFARYLTSGSHPLVARVLVNRLWVHHFGRGIVQTPGDLGYLGARPTHPDLLDWLAAEFVESGWSVKHVHRLILTSNVYQQSAVADEALVAADPENQLLGRWPLRRLESETLRDVILATAGKLETQMYGMPVPVMEDEVGQIVLGQENLDGERKPTNPIPLLANEFRRSTYIQVRRTRPLGVLESFDLPELAPNCTARASSNVTPQSLMLMNSEFMLAMSTAMAERLLSAHPDQPADQLRLGWQLAFSQSPSTAQLQQATAYLETQTQALADVKGEEGDAHKTALATFCQALLGSNQFLYIE